MADTKKKCRHYSIVYLKYGFIPSPKNAQLPMCLICKKPSRLLDVVIIPCCNKAKKDLSYFQSLRDKFHARPTLTAMFSSAAQQESDGMKASYNISFLIAKTGKPHTIGEELILPAVSEVLHTVLHKPATDIIKKIPLSNTTVQCRIDEMATDVEYTLYNYLRTVQLSLQLDESTLPGNEALLLAYVRFIKEEKINEELLFAKPLETDTTGRSIFLAVEEFFKEKGIPLTNLLAVATDGAPAMVGCHRGFIAYLKDSVPDVLVVHCVIHRQHLVAKHLTERLHCSLGYVIAAINKIRSIPLNDRLFSQLCEQNVEEFNRLLMHTEVRWLSKGACLSRFYELFETILEFFQYKEPSLRDSLKKCKSDIAYMADLFSKFNELNLQLQGSELNLIKTRSVISSFTSKLALFKRNLGRREFYQFPSVAALKENGEVHDDDIQIYCDHLDVLQKDMQERFQDILKMKIPNWVIDPFSNTDEIEMELEEELIELQTNEELKPKFKNGYHFFWLQKQISDLYPGLWRMVRKFLLAFPSSYLVERGFSVVTDFLTNKRSRRGDLRLFLTNIESNVDRLVAMHQHHPSH
ncbi:SCAN domain-containing protein 3 [Trichinella zimbabwensis]|uniref:SCAN domain-containing protein 3 n=1 Tax=Trichinella zimbabwensis TaxID=268475 RepID=A0A0V1I0Y0_9BILA|nr:SCAN domain-containing protein 3 [Trichinella zimbabwensis]